MNTLDAVLSDSSIELVFVSTINDTHFEYTKVLFTTYVCSGTLLTFPPVQAALNAGKHVVVEKPLTPTSAEAHQLAKLAKEKNLVLAVYQNRRWDSDYLTVKKLLKEGAFGELSEFQVGLRSPL